MPDLQNEIQRYCDGSIALHQLEDCLADALLAADPDEVELAGTVHIAISGLADGSLSPALLERELAKAISVFSDMSHRR